MTVGIDLDNTIVCYDEVFASAARDAGLVEPGEAPGKRALRDRLRRRPDGELAWRRLQAVVYGERMNQARLHDGARACLDRLRQAAIPHSIVSHKSAQATVDGRTVDLRRPALEWLATQGVVSRPDTGVLDPAVYFEETRREKLARIAALGVTHFVDDLVETFLEPEFPPGVVRILFAPDGVGPVDGVHVFTRWTDIEQYLFEAADAESVEHVVGAPVVSMAPLRGGRNSRVIRVTTADATQYVAKWYFGPTADGLSRLDVEVKALRFLRAAGVDVVPCPLGSHPGRGLAVFEYIDGDTVSPDAATPADVDALVGFLGTLMALRTMPAAAALPRASEASFSMSALVASVERRRARLEDVAGSGPEVEALRGFLRHEFDAAFPEVIVRARRPVAGVAYDEDIPLTSRTLSPSDYGFHNVIRRRNGSLAFHDFEYFGWDDPAKLCSDVVLHPAAPLGEGLRNRFVTGVRAVFGGIPGFRDRLAAMYPLCGLMWVMILLNEFHRDDLARRQFAGEPAAATEVRMRQLSNARAMLARVVHDHDREVLAS